MGTPDSHQPSNTSLDRRYLFAKTLKKKGWAAVKADERFAVLRSEPKGEIDLMCRFFETASREELVIYQMFFEYFNEDRPAWSIVRVLQREPEEIARIHLATRVAAGRLNLKELAKRLPAQRACKKAAPRMGESAKEGGSKNRKKVVRDPKQHKQAV